MKVNPVSLCPVCGISDSEIKESGRFGCNNCYSHFINLAKSALTSNQGKSSYSYSKPDYVMNICGEKKADISSEHYQQKLIKLKDALQQAVKLEEYEKAASLTKSIKELVDNTVSGNKSFKDLESVY